MEHGAMTIDEARSILAGEVDRDDHPSGATCGVCGIPLHIWWTPEQYTRHRRYHQAQAVAAGAR